MNDNLVNIAEKLLYKVKTDGDASCFLTLLEEADIDELCLLIKSV